MLIYIAIEEFLFEGVLYNIDDTVPEEVALKNLKLVEQVELLFDNSSKL